MPTENDIRADRAFRTRLYYQQVAGCDRDSCLVDLLADLMLDSHLHYGGDFEDALATARMHCEAELEEAA